ncbi:MAG: hypothetical protein CMG66_06705 [Candidatus Marinimicrobia bacterium]|nr:hypothetical protein [Candidatus Neomarinimicrobiota bacterium]
MSYNERTDMLKFAIYLNLFLGIYNIYLFYYSSYLFNIIIGSLNIGVWVFFRDMKLVHTLLKKKYGNKY